jgi:outer membrane protein TolC
MYRYSITAVLLFLIVGFPLFAQQHNLEYYLQTGVENSPLLKDYQNQASIAGLEDEMLKATYYKPQLSGTAEVMQAPLINGVGYDQGITNGGLYAAMMQVDQQLFTEPFVKTGQEQNRLIQEQSGYRGKISARDLKRQITEKYITCYIDLRHHAYMQQLCDLLKEQYNLSLQLAKSGVLKASDVILLEIESTSQQNQLAALSAQYMNDLSAMNSLCGISDTGKVEVTEPLLVLNDSNSSSGISRFLYQYTLDSLLTDNSRKTFELKYKPRLSAYANAGLNAVKIPDIQDKFGFSAGLRLSVTLFDGKQKSINWQETQIKLQTLEDYKSYTSNQQYLMRTNLLRQISLAGQRMNLSKEQLKKYNQLLRIYRQELAQGDISVNDFLTTLRTYKSTQDEYLNYYQQKLITINAFNYWNW